LNLGDPFIWSFNVWCISMSLINLSLRFEQARQPNDATSPWGQ
jgi:hypothetical protein